MKKDYINESNLYKLFLNLTPFPIWIESINTEIIYLNKAYETTFNIKLKDVIGKKNIEVFPEKISKKYNEEINLCIKNKNNLIFEDKVNNSQSECYMFPIADKSNVIRFIGGIIINIDERHKKQIEIEKQKNILRTIIDALPEAIFFKDTESKFIGYNKNFQEFYSSLGIDKIIGKSDLDIYPDKKTALEFIKLDKKIMSTKEPRYSQYEIVNNDGNKQIEESIKVPVIGDKGDVLGIVGLSRDITQSKKLEEKLWHLSYTDALTGLFNRTSFEEKITELNTDENLPLGIIMGDVNGLKIVNDTLGHLEGDKLLVNISNVLKSVFNEKGFIFRWGGDEFVILLPNCNESRCNIFTKQILECCNKQEYEFIQLNIALGVTVKNKIEDNIYDCLKEVENKLYRRKLLEQKSIRSSIMTSLKKSLQEKNMETEEHTDRVSSSAYSIGKKLNFNPYELDELLLVASLHDIGKIGIPEDILLKPGKLSNDEFEIMKSHTEKGYRLIHALGELDNVAKCILTHHEKYDGSGYPLGLKGDEIPLIARIISIADSFDVMTHERPYKKAISTSNAISELKHCSGTHFDPNLVDIFISNFEDKEIKN